MTDSKVGKPTEKKNQIDNKNIINKCAYWAFLTRNKLHFYNK